LIDLSFSFGQIDSSLESFKGIDFDLASNNHGIAFGDFVFRVSELLREFAIVGQQDQSCAGSIESADGEETVLIGHKIDHAGATFRIAVGA
jgi:hypothetical protein